MTPIERAAPVCGPAPPCGCHDLCERCCPGFEGTFRRWPQCECPGCQDRRRRQGLAQYAAEEARRAHRRELRALRDRVFAELPKCRAVLEQIRDAPNTSARDRATAIAGLARLARLLK